MQRILEYLSAQSALAVHTSNRPKWVHIWSVLWLAVIKTVVHIVFHFTALWMHTPAPNHFNESMETMISERNQLSQVAQIVYWLHLLTLEGNHPGCESEVDSLYIVLKMCSADNVGFTRKIVNLRLWNSVRKCIKLLSSVEHIQDHCCILYVFQLFCDCATKKLSRR